MKTRKIISLVLNGLAVVASMIGLILLKDSGALIYIKYFTILTNCAIIIAGITSIGYSVEYLLKKDKEVQLPAFAFVLKLITAVSALITFLTVVCYLQYQPGLVDAPVTSILFWNNICHHYVGPLAFILGFILFDVDRKYIAKLAFFGPMLLAIYGLYIAPICMIKPDLIGGAPYPFLDTTKISIGLIPVFLLLFTVVGFGLSFALWLLNRICFLIFVGDDVSQTELTKEEEESVPAVTVEEEDIKEVKEIEKSGYTGPRIYHISKRQDKMWQVKFANGKKAIKLFPTQAEAIVFAKKLAKSQEGSIRVHSLKGRIRKSK